MSPVFHPFSCILDTGTPSSVSRICLIPPANKMYECEGLQRDTLAQCVPNETQAHRLCCLPPSPAQQNVVYTPPWSWASAADALRFVGGRHWRGKKLELMTTGVRRRRRRWRVGEPHFPLLYRLILIGLEVRKCRPGSLRWEIEVTRSAWRQRLNNQ